MDTSIIFRGSVFTGGKRVKTGVRVEDGLIVAVGDGDLGSADRVIELNEDQVLAPAGVEVHAGMRDWGEAPRDTVETVTRAALGAGVTFVCDQANSSPRLNTPELVKRRGEFIASKSYTDFGVAAHPPVEPGRISEYREAGACILQLFPWDFRAWNQSLDSDPDVAAFRRYAESGLTATIYAEDWATNKLLPDIAESLGLEGLLRRLDPSHHVRLVVSLPSSVETILAARDRLPNVLIQCGPPMVLMSRKVGYERIGIAAIASPPLRSEEDVARMREFAEQGVIDVFAAHHSAYKDEEKYITDPVPGEYTPKANFSSIDIAYPLMLSRFGLEVACRAYSETPARQLGLNKGRIAKGYEADLVILDEHPGGGSDINVHVTGQMSEAVWRVAPRHFQSMCKVTPFIGERLKYRAAKTFLRGEEAFDRASGTFNRLAVRQGRG